MSMLKLDARLPTLALLPMLLCAIVMRLWPHPANITPCLAFAWLGAQYFRRRDVWLALLLLWVGTDVSLAMAHGQYTFGNWTFFTYSAMMAVTYLSSSTRLGLGTQCVCLVSASVGFWCWTNLGVWLFGGIYVHTGAGFIEAYVKALPFLRNQVLGDVAWFGCMYMYLAWVSVRHRDGAKMIGVAHG